MRALVKPLETQAEAALAAAYASSREDVSGAWRDARDRAFAAFKALGLPSRRVESWHYTDLRAIMRDAVPLAPPRDAPAPRGLRIKIADGSASSSLAYLAWPAGLRVRRLRDAVAADGAAFLAKLYPEQGGGDAVVALNAAMARDGVVIEAEPGAVIDAPIEIAHGSASADPCGDFSRSLVLVGEGASLTLVESHASSARVQRNSALVFRLGAGAGVEHVFIAEEHNAEIHIATLIAEIAAGAAFNSFALVAAGNTLRRQCFARCAGERARLAFRGVALLDGARHADTTLVVDHAAPHGESRELFKHVLAGEATGVFQGKVIVRPGAQKVDGGMKSHAVMLSDGAAMFNKPELEIFADDVVCGHGATAGQIDKDQLFYMMARGLPRAGAEALLIEGFAREAVELVSNAATRERLEAQVARWLAGRSP